MNPISTFFAPFKAYTNMIIGGVLLAVVLATGLYVWTLRTEVTKQNEKIAAMSAANINLKSEISLLREGLVIAEQANAVSNDTIQKLLIERQKASAAVEALAKKDIANNKKISDLNAYIDTMSKDPSNDGTLAPVLVETLKSIKQRKEAK